MTAAVTSSVTSRGRHAPPPSPLTRHSTSGSTTVVADVHRDATTAQPRSVSGTAAPPRPRDQYRQEVVTPRQRFAVPDDRRGRVLRRPVAEVSAAAEREERQWSSLEHGVVEPERRSSDLATRRVHSYEDRYLLQRQKAMQQQQQCALMPPVRRRLPNANDPLRITEFSTSDDVEYDYATSGVYGVCSRPTRAPPLSPARQPVVAWTEAARLQSTRSSADLPISSRRLPRIAPSPGVVEVRSVDRAELLVRQTSTVQASGASRTSPGSLDTVMPPRRLPSPDRTVQPPPSTPVVHSTARSNDNSSPANSRRERYGIATIMSRTAGGTPRQQPAITAAVQPNSLSTQPAESTAALDTTQSRAGADNSFDSVPTDYDISDTTSRSRSGEPVTTTSMDSSSSATGAATAGSGGGGSQDTDSTDKSGGAGSHKLHQMRDDSGYKSLETQQSLGKSGIGVASASLLARIGTRSMDRSAPGLFQQPPAAAVVGRTQYSLEAPSLPVKFAATSPKLKDIFVPVPQLPIQDVKVTHPVEQPVAVAKSSNHSTLSEFLAGISSTTTDDPAGQKKPAVPFVAENAFLEKFAERTQTVGRALTSSFDRIRQQAGSFLSRTTAVVRGASDVEAPAALHPFVAPFRRASSSDCQSSWTEKDSKLMPVADPYHRRSTSGEVLTKDTQSQSIGITSSDNMEVRSSGPSVRLTQASPTSPRMSSSVEPARDKTAFTGGRTAGPQTVLATTPNSFQSLRSETHKQTEPPVTHQVLVSDSLPRATTHRHERSIHGGKTAISPANQASIAVHPAWTHAKQTHETVGSTTDFGRGNKKTASKRRRDYRSKKQIQEVHHSGSLTETTSQHQPVGPVHGYSAVVGGGDPSSSDNSLEQPSTTSGGGSGVTTVWNNLRPLQSAVVVQQQFETTFDHFRWRQWRFRCLVVV